MYIIIIFLDSACKWYHMTFVLLCLTCFTHYDSLWVHPCCCKWQYCILFKRVSDIPLTLESFRCWDDAVGLVVLKSSASCNVEAGVEAIKSSVGEIKQWKWVRVCFLWADSKTLKPEKRSGIWDVYGCSWAFWFGVWNRLPRCHSGRESACQRGKCERLGFDPWVGKAPWGRKGQPIPIFLPGISRGQRSLMGYSPWGCKRVWYSLVTEWACIRKCGRTIWIEGWFCV